MASKERETFSDLEQSLLKEGPAYSFFQAIRLLRLILRRREECGLKDAASLEGRFLRIRPELTLGFPSADIAGIEAIPLADGEHRFVVNTTFLGLYGTSSPLPSFYTEDLLIEAGDDKSVTRDFIDIVNSTIYPLFVRSLLKYNLFLQICEEQDREYLQRIYCLMGMGDSSDRTPAERRGAKIAFTVRRPHEPAPALRTRPENHVKRRVAGHSGAYQAVYSANGSRACRPAEFPGHNERHLG